MIFAHRKREQVGKLFTFSTLSFSPMIGDMTYCAERNLLGGENAVHDVMAREGMEWAEK